MESSGLTISEVSGGGKVKIITIPKTIYVWGKSSVYGEAPFQDIEIILKRAYPSHLILNETPPEE